MEDSPSVEGPRLTIVDEGRSAQPRRDRPRKKEWPNGAPGNRRTGPIRNRRARGPGNKKGNTPADSDPLIMQRREFAAPLWERGFSGPAIRKKLNLWLAGKGYEGVSLETIYKDHGAIKAEWRRSYASTIDEARVEHMASLQKLKAKAWEDLERAGYYGESTSPYINNIRQIEADIARLDGSMSRQDIDVTSGGKSIMESLAAALALPPPVPITIVEAREDTEEFEKPIGSLLLPDSTHDQGGP